MKYFSRYIPLTDEARRQSLYVLASGYTIIPPHTPYPPSIHPADHQFRWEQGRMLREYQLVYIARGGGVFESRSAGRRRIEAGTLFMLFPGEWHRYSPDAEIGWDEYWVAFQGPTAETLVSESSLTCAEPLLGAPLSDRIQYEFVQIMEEMRREAIGYQKVIGARTMLILATATASVLRHEFEGASVLGAIERGKGVLFEQIDRNVNMEEMAAELGVGYSLFRKAFRQYTGMSPAQYHLELRVNEASHLLRTTTLPVAKVAMRLGFDSASYFCRIFKKKTGQTPCEYRMGTQGIDDPGLYLTRSLT
ncbi:transcriptional regulator [Capsulimonas corticalis]|uniref:Transcriptional regulator n=1 Tax=Capsulimonas corticalis TaxID=2219043 RepID=A0A402CQ69_9BACT|nr:AraC family transcriptional regulator [Capsulimonas corticalis]BDI32856.1 transcriptional regulator [Capsulimonas corticalis]